MSGLALLLLGDSQQDRFEQGVQVMSVMPADGCCACYGDDSKSCPVSRFVILYFAVPCA